MKKYIEYLSQLAEKEERNILGMMSGTSMDGLDLAYCKFKGHGRDTNCELLVFETVPFSTEQKEIVKKVFLKREVDLQDVCLVHAYLGDLFADLCLNFLEKHDIDPKSIDCIASHGQTIYHAPIHQHQLPGFPNATLQIGEADRIAVKTGILTISDFRQKHIAIGGEGAPLVVYGDYLLFSSPDENRLLLNIGGIANFTYLPASMNPDEIICSDTGPGNCLIDLFTHKFFADQEFDKDSLIAYKGTLAPDLLEALKKNPFFEQELPKTTGRELFTESYVISAIQESGKDIISAPDIINSLTHFAADTISDLIKQNIPGGTCIYTSGGGVHNPLLMQLLKEQLSAYQWKDIQELGILPDAKEAMLFALLANETLAGEGLAIGGLPAVTLGKISMPS